MAGFERQACRHPFPGNATPAAAAHARPVACGADLTAGRALTERCSAAGGPGRGRRCLWPRLARGARPWSAVVIGDRTPVASSRRPQALAAGALAAWP
ncbi:MAG: hypothetical protein M5U01_22860 [Ardenticatenaceae bacterium]|nr:hypothetical protein [Ardenticatenaceae bacterium]